jgi:hypothetical protein
MTAKEKARELVDKLYPRVTSYSLDRKNQNENAKQCALITVEEILDSYTNEKSNGFIISDKIILYWQEVKQEIINL